MMLKRRPGMSFVELLVALALTGVIALIVSPKMLSTVDTNKRTVEKIDQILQEVAMVLEIERSNQGIITEDIQLITSDPYFKSSLYQSLRRYGHYLKIYHTQNPATPSPTQYYFLYPDGTRLSATPEVFSRFSPLTEYKNGGLGAGMWGPYFSGITGTVATAFAIDINGKAPPNKPGKNGDLILFVVDPATGNIQSHFQAMYKNDDTYPPNGSPPSYLCAYYSIYDQYKKSKYYQFYDVSCP